MVAASVFSRALIAVALASTLGSPSRLFAQEAAPALRVGPELHSLAEHLDHPASPGERASRWSAARGTLTSGKGVVVAVSDTVLLDCPPENGKDGPHVFIRAVPDPELKGVLETVRIGQQVEAQGRVAGAEIAPAGLGATSGNPFQLRDARILLSAESIAPPQRRMIGGLLVSAVVLTGLALFWFLRRPLPER